MVFVSRYSRAVVLLATLAGGQAILPVSSLNSSAPSVDLGYVKYQGITNATAGINYFRGIQYVKLFAIRHKPYIDDPDMPPTQRRPDGRSLVPSKRAISSTLTLCTMRAR